MTEMSLAAARLRVAVLGGGLQGCCTALALAARGARVTLYDRNAALLSRAAVANEGKIHLGYMYAADPDARTASVMLQGALSFAPFFQRHLGDNFNRDAVSAPAAYLVHRDSQRTPEQVASYMARTHALIAEAAKSRPKAYFGQDVFRPPRAWTANEIELEFNVQQISAAFDTPEVAIDPVALAVAVRERIAAEPRISVRLGETVTAVAPETDGWTVRLAGKAERARFHHVVNALWDGRLALDRTAGLDPGRRWLHRLKYGVSFRQRQMVCRRSATIVSGPFGEIVSYGCGLTYLTWYPTCLLAMSDAVAPPDWPNYPPEPVRSQVAAGTLAALSEIVPALGTLTMDDLEELIVKGGVIVAWGETDIYDRASELHQRYRIGVTSKNGFHSVDPGKLTMAPFFAEACADRIVGEPRG